MKQKIKEKWIDALRSGEYQQGTGYLKVIHENGDIKHCCLGVLCELAIKDNLDLSTTETERVWESDLITATSFNGEEEYPPEEMDDWAELPDFLVLELLSEKNDKGQSFDQIADYIEAEL